MDKYKVGDRVKRTDGLLAGVIAVIECRNVHALVSTAWIVTYGDGTKSSWNEMFFELEREEPMNKFKKGDRVKYGRGSLVSGVGTVAYDHTSALCTPGARIVRDDGVKSSSDGTWWFAYTDLELISTIDPVTFEYKGKTYEPNGDFREPEVGEPFFHAEDGDVVVEVNVAAMDRRISRQNIGRNRIILREVEKKERVLTLDNLTVMKNQITVRCNACDCNDVVGNIVEVYDGKVTHFYHEGQEHMYDKRYALAYIDVNEDIHWGRNVKEGDITVEETK